MTQFDFDNFPNVLRDAQNGSEAAFRTLYREYQPYLLRFLRSRARFDAEDIASEVWASIAKGLSRFVGDEPAFRAWIFATARRRIIDLYRRQAVRPRITTEIEVDDFAAHATAEQLEIDEAIAALVACLNDDQAEIVLLRVLGGFSAKEVGEMVGKSEAAVRVIQHRALGKIAEQLKDRT